MHIDKSIKSFLQDGKFCARISSLQSFRFICFRDKNLIAKDQKMPYKIYGKSKMVLAIFYVGSLCLEP